MSSVKAEIDVPVTLLPYINHGEYKTQQTALLLYPYILNGDISNGKAAELLGMSKTELLDMFGEMGIPYYNQTCEELESDIEVLRELRNRK
ncbi:MAG: UPF0175 family protein [Synergistaceae bacterium]|nr:UPF0175 family protein [Synergistaceae bacterium]MBQ9904002.1 UPF0175 family protein [Synergistaceae bacterium]